MQVSKTLQQAHRAVHGHLTGTRLRTRMSRSNASVSQAFLDMIPALDGAAFLALSTACLIGRRSKLRDADADNETC